MNFVGKIFVFLIALLSLMFATMAIMIYATHKNYRAEILRTPAEVRGAERVGWKYQLQEAYKERERLEQEKKQLSLQYEAEIIAKSQALAKSEATNQILSQENKIGAEQLTQKAAQLNSVTETLKVTQANLTNSTTEVQNLRKDIAAAHNDTDKQIKRATELTDKLTVAEGQRELLTERNQQLATDVSKAKTVLGSLGRTLSDPLDAKAIKVAGKITEVSRDRVELSIGFDDGVRKGQNLDIYRGDKYVGRVKVVESKPDSAAGRHRN